MAVTWTEEQKKVIEVRDSNVLVSAAAGSGKTAVLVARIISMITDKTSPVDIDHLLVVTFTNAAAAEMRERVRNAIEKKLMENPDDVHLQKQSTLIHNAQITTIHSFCQYVIRNYFHTIGLDPSFRIAEEGELKLLKNEVLGDLIEEACQEDTQEFQAFAAANATGKGDKEIEELILQVYEFSMSFPWPKKWMALCRESYDMPRISDFYGAPWQAYLLNVVNMLLKDVKTQCEMAIQVCEEEDGPFMYKEALESDLDLVKIFMGAGSYEEVAKFLRQGIKYKMLSRKQDVSVSDAKRELVKSMRDDIKEGIKNIVEQYFYDEPEQMWKDMKGSRENVEVLMELTEKFYEDYTARKREKNIADFSDLEHLALEILVKKEEGVPVPTQVAEELSLRYGEVMIDEYQDSNMVQELILTSVSGKARGVHNLFMVGDVKQSIYRFRLARPEIFMEKYHSYSLEEGENQRIDLHKNFRSRKEVLESTNYIFMQIMGKSLGNIQYGEDVALYPGARFPENSREKAFHTEVLLLDLDRDSEILAPSGESDRELEARMIGARIREMVGNEQVTDKETGTCRPVEYRDIVILLRTVSGWAEDFIAILAQMDIPAYTGSQRGYFAATEVQVILAMLKIIDNPLQEIPMTAVLASPIVGLTTRELALIKTEYPEVPYVNACMLYGREGEKRELREKLQHFFVLLNELRDQVPYTTIHQLLWEIYEKTGYEELAFAMPGGQQRKANLDMLVEKAIAYEKTSYRGLFHFIRYIEGLQKYDVDYGEASVLGEEENTVRIMSIHKSKGLEFPVVFVSGLNKNFNKQDSRRKLVMDPELNLGCDFVDPKLRVKSPTLLKRVIQNKLNYESLGEELRVLYVAMTRAGEKLILTGAVSKMEKRLERWERSGSWKGEKLSFTALTGASGFLDWIMPAVMRGSEGKELNEGIPHPENIIPLIYTAGDLVLEESGAQLNNRYQKASLLSVDGEQEYHEETRKLLENNLTRTYPYESGLNIYGKVTVSELKKQSQVEEQPEGFVLYEEPQIVPLIPRFLTEESLSGAARGTIYHKILEKLDYTCAGDSLQIQEQIRKMVEDQRLTEKDASCVEADKLLRFVRSPVGLRMGQAAREGRLYREQPFVLGVSANEINVAWDENAMVLVQGIIDAYFIEENQITLVDYKTDVVKQGQEKLLADRYATQLKFYARALEQLTPYKVKERKIYSFALQKELSIN